MTYKYNILVFIGRFQPFHLGHKAVLDKALELSERVLVLIGSSNRSRDGRNPFTFDERRKMIFNTYGFSDLTSTNDLRYQRIMVSPLDDIMYNDDLWIQSVQQTVQDEILTLANQSKKVWIRGLNDLKIGLIGCKKDNSSYYLKLFPTWDSEPIEFVNPINATDIRKDYFAHNRNWSNVVPSQVNIFMEKFAKTTTFEALVTAAVWHENYKRNVQKYPRIEHTVDSVVIQSGHILLVRRRAEPGKGLWALPGGFLNVEERMLDGALRELREETKLAIPEPVLRGSLVGSRTYDDPNRSLRGRLITQAYLFRLTKTSKLPKIKGSDDADKARWVPLSELEPTKLFEDHFFIIRDLLGAF